MKKRNPSLTKELLTPYGCGPIRFSGRNNAL
jgi:hypothetical protein